MKGFPPLLHSVLVSMPCFSDFKSAWALISTYRRLVIFHCREVAPSLAQPSVVPPQPEGLTQDRRVCQPSPAGSRGRVTSHSPSLVDQTGSAHPHTWLGRARHSGLMMCHDESKVTLQGEKTHPCDIHHSRHSVHTGHYLQTLKVSPAEAKMFYGE